MSQQIRIGVTGVGGGCGQAIMKALLAGVIHGYTMEIFPADVTPFSPGLHAVRNPGAVLPKPEQDIRAWKRWALESRLQVIFPGSDHDLFALSRERDVWYDQHQIRIVVSPPSCITMANDKAATHVALSKIGAETPKSFFSDESQLIEWYKSNELKKVVIKPRYGMTSRGLNIAIDEEELLFYWKRTQAPIAQEFIEGDEYTATVTCNRFGDADSVFVMKRQLYAGTTYIATPELSESISMTIKDVCRKLIQSGYKFLGGVNFQFKLTEAGPCIFEINARSSGSTAIRAEFGYNEPVMMVKNLLHKIPLYQPVIRSGVAMRFWEESYLFDVTMDDVAQLKSGLKGHFPSWL